MKSSLTRQYFNNRGTAEAIRYRAAGIGFMPASLFDMGNFLPHSGQGMGIEEEDDNPD